MLYEEVSSAGFSAFTKAMKGGERGSLLFP